jgi:hypothetical protein
LAFRSRRGVSRTRLAGPLIARPWPSSGELRGFSFRRNKRLSNHLRTGLGDPCRFCAFDSPGVSASTTPRLRHRSAAERQDFPRLFLTSRAGPY